MADLAMRATALWWRIGGVGRIGLSGFGRSGFLQQKDMLQIAHLLATAGMPQAVIAELVETDRQDVLEEAPDELVAGHGLLALAVGGAVLVAVGDGDAEGVAGEIVERGLLSLAPWRDVNDPGDLPEMGRQVGVRAEPGEGIAEAGAGKGGERRLREQKCFGGGMPGGAVVGQSAAGDEAVNVRWKTSRCVQVCSTARTPTMPPTQRGSRAKTRIALAAALISAP